MNLKDVYEVTITNLDHQGRAIAKIDNKVVFIPNALVDEKVKIEITNIKKDFLEGTITTILEESKDRIRPVCPYYSICGGCDLMHMPYSKQLEYKENKIKNIMSKYCHLDNVVKNIIPSPQELYYRNKLTLKVKSKIGLYKKKSYEIIEIDKCLITNNYINECLPRIRLIKNLKNIEQIIIRVSDYNNELLIILETIGLIDETPWINLGKEDNINVVLRSKNSYKTLIGNKYIEDYIGNYKFKISASAFFQINHKQTVNLYNKIKELAYGHNQNVLDLYCGIGTIGMYLSDNIQKLVGIEINEDSINDANINKNINNISNASFYSGDVEKVLKDIKFNPDIIIVDPPRAGLHENVSKKLLELEPNKIIYVSCDPITLARDLNILKEKYTINEITPFDMFPNTYHVETVTLLCSKKNE